MFTQNEHYILRIVFPWVDNCICLQMCACWTGLTNNWSPPLCCGVGAQGETLMLLLLLWKSKPAKNWVSLDFSLLSCVYFESAPSNFRVESDGLPLIFPKVRFSHKNSTHKNDKWSFAHDSGLACWPERGFWSMKFAEKVYVMPLWFTAFLLFKKVPPVHFSSCILSPNKTIHNLGVHFVTLMK